MLRTNEMGQTGGIGTVTTAWFGGSRAGTLIGQAGEISSTVRRRVYSYTRNGTRRSRRRNRRTDRDQAAIRDKLDRVQSHDARQSVSRFASADTDAVPKAVGWLSHECTFMRVQRIIYDIYIYIIKRMRIAYSS